jgi:hypothetical protein
MKNLQFFEYVPYRTEISYWLRFLPRGRISSMDHEKIHI